MSEDIDGRIKALVEHCREMKKDMERSEVVYKVIHAQGLEDLKDEFGRCEVEKMLESQAATESFLTHSDPGLRTAALCLLAQHWKPTQKSAAVAEQLIKSEEDEQVLRAAMLYLSCFYPNRHNDWIVRLLAEIVRDKRRGTKVRSSAYHALFAINGKVVLGSKGEVVYGPDIFCFRFPEDVDWAYVESL